MSYLVTLQLTSPAQYRSWNGHWCGSKYVRPPFVPRLLYSSTAGFAESTAMEWAYWGLRPGIECVFRPVGDDMYEVVVLVSQMVHSRDISSTEWEHRISRLWTTHYRRPTSR